MSSFSQTWPICVPTFTDQPLITEGMKVKTQNANGKEVIILNFTSQVDAFGFGVREIRDTKRLYAEILNRYSGLLSSVAEEIWFTLKHSKWYSVLLFVLPINLNKELELYVEILNRCPGLYFSVAEEVVFTLKHLNWF